MFYVLVEWNTIAHRRRRCLRNRWCSKVSFDAVGVRQLKLCWTNTSVGEVHRHGNKYLRFSVRSIAQTKICLSDVNSVFQVFLFVIGLVGAEKLC